MLEFLSLDYRECLKYLQRLIDIHPNMAGCLGRARTLSSVACLLPESSSPLLGYRGSEHSTNVPADKQNTRSWHRRSQSAIERPLYHITSVCCVANIQIINHRLRPLFVLLVHLHLEGDRPTRLTETHMSSSHHL